ncbi:ABC transporter permease [Spirillospora sp. CA-255316]
MPDVNNVLRLVSPRRVSILYLLAVIFVVFSVAIPDLFLSSITMQSVASSEAVVAILALAALLPFVAGEFDITIGFNMALSVVIVCWLSINQPGTSLMITFLVAILVSGLVGVVNGLLVVKLRVNSFIATLAVSQVLVAIALYLSDNRQMSATFSPDYVEFARGRTLGVPNALYCTLVMAIILWYVLQWTKLGRHLYACGMNREAARLSGIRTEAMVMGSFVASGLIAGIAGVVFASQVGVFSNSIGGPLLFPAFAAVFLGATQFNFRPNVWGTVLAIFTLALGVQGLQLATSTGGFWVTPLFDGLALIAAVVFSKRHGLLAKRKASGQGGDQSDSKASSERTDVALANSSPASRE